MAFMDEKKIKQLEDYFSSLKNEFIIKYPSPHDNEKPQYLIVVKVENGKVRGQISGPYGPAIIPLDYLIEKGFEIANFKGIKKVLKKKSKK